GSPRRHPHPPRARPGGRRGPSRRGGGPGRHAGRARAADGRRGRRIGRARRRRRDGRRALRVARPRPPHPGLRAEALHDGGRAVPARAGHPARHGGARRGRGRPRRRPGGRPRAPWRGGPDLRHGPDDRPGPPGRHHHRALAGRGPCGRRRERLRPPARPARVGLPHVGLRRPAQRARLQPRPDRHPRPLLPGQPGAVRRAGLRARAAARGRAHGRQGAHGRRPGGRRRARLGRVAAPLRARRAHEPAVGQLLRRDAAQGARRAGPRGGLDLRRRPGGARRPARPRHRAPGERRLRPRAREPHLPAGGRHAAALAGQGSRQRPADRGVAAGRRAQRDADGAHARDARGGQLPREDGIAELGLRPGGLLHCARRLAHGVRLPHERGLPARRPRAAGPHGRGARALRAL
ncbi:MAG: D-alanyl-D-alanine carboxypeptidase, partial [uncultured Solirubrobacteraceae bacterium]